MKDESLRQMLREEFIRRMPDFYRLAKKFQRHKATLQVSGYCAAVVCPTHLLQRVTVN